MTDPDVEAVALAINQEIKIVVDDDNGPLVVNPLETARAAIAADPARKELIDALQDLHDDCVEYCRINNLHNNDGGPGTNHAMRRARAALSRARGGTT
jgi:hypothetical protein